MENIALKIKALNYEEKYYPTINKFFAALSDEVVSLEELVRIVNFLSEKGITLTPADNKVLASGFDYIKQIVEDYEKNEEIAALIENPSRINCKFGLERLIYMKNNNVPYKNEENKYSSIPFSKRAFDKKFGVIEFSQNIPSKSTELNETPISENTNEEKINEFIPPTPIVEKRPVEEEIILDPIESILSKPQTISFDDEMFERYERLSESIIQILYQVYNIEEISQNISDNLIKLVTNDIEDDKLVLYYALTYGKTLNEAEQERLKQEIEYNLSMSSGVSKAA